MYFCWIWQWRFLCFKRLFKVRPEKTVGWTTKSVVGQTTNQCSKIRERERKAVKNKVVLNEHAHAILQFILCLAMSGQPFIFFKKIVLFRVRKIVVCHVAAPGPYLNLSKCPRKNNNICETILQKKSKKCCEKPHVPKFTFFQPRNVKISGLWYVFFVRKQTFVP